MKKMIGAALIIHCLCCEAVAESIPASPEQSTSSKPKQNSFSDDNTPQVETKEVKQPSLPTTTNPIPKPSEVTKEEKPIPNYTIEITSPAPEQTFQNEADPTTVTLSIKPELEQDDTVEVLLDGSAVGEPSHSSSVTLPRLERGSHTLQAKIIQPKGKGAISDTITIYQQHPSKLMPR